MTTGALIYLVSACGSGEEFVAAFRRYADRSGLFIPIAEPIPVGRRGRFAVALRDGGVMIEGEAEVVSSTRTPSVLHGRVGMTLRFVAPDEPSKIVLVELEKARLSMRPPPPSVPPRPADVPPAPRPVPPAVTGRVDATNALAECVAIGDVDALEGGAAGAAAAGAAAGAPRKTGQKFVVPSIPPVAAKKPSASMAVAAVYDADVDLPTLTRPPIEADMAADVAADVLATGRDSMTSIEPLPPPPSSSAAAKRVSEERPTEAMPPLPAPRPPAPRDTEMMQPFTKPMGNERPTEAMAPLPAPRSPAPRDTEMMQPVDKAAALSSVAAPPAVPRPAPPIIGTPPLEELGHVEISGEPTDLTTIPLDAVEIATGPTTVAAPPRAPRPTPTAPVQVPPAPPVAAKPPAPPVAVKPPPAPAPAASSGSVSAASSAPTNTSTSTPTNTPTNTPALPLPVFRPAPSRSPEAPTAAKAAAAIEAIEAIEAQDALDALDLDTPRPPVVGTPPAAPERPPNIEEPTPSGDWTMIPGADGPTIQPRVRPSVPATQAGNWSISLSSSSGAAAPAVPSTAGGLRSDPMPVVASTRPLESEPARSPAPVLFSEPKVQIDPTLIEPLLQMPPEPAPEPAPPMPLAAAPPPMPLAPAPAPVAPLHAAPSGSQPMLDVIAASSSGDLHLGGVPTPPPPGFAPPPGSYPSFPADAGQSAPQFPPTRPSDVISFGPGGSYPAVAMARPRRTRVIVIAVSAVLVLAGGAAALFVIGDSAHPGTAPRPSQPRAATDPVPDGAEAPAPDARELAAVPGDAAAEEPARTEDAGAAAGSAAPPGPAGPGSAAPPPAGEGCKFDVASTPAGAEVVLGKTEVLGTTPATLTLPCGIEVRLAFRKARFVTSERKYTPTAARKPLKVTLARPTYSLKVSSVPSGASVTVGGKPQGFTPTTIRVPINETSTLTFSKDGFGTETQKVTASKNNQSVTVTLKRTRRGR